MLGSTQLILFAIYFLPKLNPNFIPKEIKLWISCFSSSLYHVWCHFAVEKNLTFSSRSVLTTTGLRNKENSKTITSCKDTLVCCCERWAHTIQDCTTETWVDYCPTRWRLFIQSGDNETAGQLLLEVLSLCYSAWCSGSQFIIPYGFRAMNCAHLQTCKRT